MIAHTQDGFRIRFDWGPTGGEAIGRDASVVAVVDVLSFTTTLTVAIDEGIEVFPYRFRDDTAVEYAHRHQATLAIGRSEATNPGDVSLSPVSIRRSSISRLVLPSPNGSTISQQLASLGATVIGVCLRNIDAAASWTAQQLAQNPHATVAVVAAGERWRDDSLRPAIEDLWGAGAFLSALTSSLPAWTVSPEAGAAIAAYERDADHLPQLLPECASGRELLAAGYPEDVEIALEINGSRNVPVLHGVSFSQSR